METDDYPNYGGDFYLDIYFLTDYPFKPLKITSLRKSIIKISTQMAVYNALEFYMNSGLQLFLI